MSVIYDWDNRYRQGGISGEGSIGKYREWKWKIIDKYFDNFDNIIDVGCGNISFWEGRDAKQYIGMDISPTIIEKNRTKRPHWTFLCNPAEKPIHKTADYVICFDLLFHIMDDDIYQEILQNLIEYSNNAILIYTWIRNPLNDKDVKRNIRGNFLRKGLFGKFIESFFKDLTTDYYYQTYRDFNKYLKIFERKGFVQIAIEPNPLDDIGALIIFKKQPEY
jgi:2-polyprenyl-3-methyl-5-hydroxy-6-metoxy-1,4-benzoquinol methylase